MGQADSVRPGERATRVVHTAAHGRVAAGGVAHALIHRIGGLVGEHAHGAHDDEARDVVDDADLAPERLKEPHRPCQCLRRGLVGGGDHRALGLGEVERQVEDDEILQVFFHRALGGQPSVGECEHRSAHVQVSVFAGLAFDGDACCLDGADEWFGDAEIAFDGDGVRPRSGRGGGGGRGLRAFAVVIEAAATLAPEKPTLDVLALQQRWQKSRVLVVGVEYRLGDGEIHVLTDQIHELERAHAEAATFLQRRVDGDDVRAAFLEHAQRLGVERPGDAVDDEPGRGARVYRVLAPGRGGGMHRLGDGGVGGDATDHLHELENGRGVEEMHAHQALGALEPRADGGHRDRGGVGGEDDVFAAECFKLAEYLLLDRQVLDDGLHHETRGGELGGSGHRPDAADDSVHLLAGHPAALDEPFHARAGALDAFLRGALGGVEEQHRVAGGGGYLGDAGAHGAGADDADGRVSGQCAHGIPAHLPWKSGSRLSMKAATPSR